MARPQRSTRDAWIDTFADWPAAEQEAALDLAACVHRQTKRKAKPETKANDQPDLLDPAHNAALRESE